MCHAWKDVSTRKTKTQLYHYNTITVTLLKPVASFLYHLWYGVQTVHICRKEQDRLIYQQYPGNMFLKCFCQCIPSFWNVWSAMIIYTFYTVICEKIEFLPHSRTRVSLPPLLHYELFFYHSVCIWNHSFQRDRWPLPLVSTVCAYVTYSYDF